MNVSEPCVFCGEPVTPGVHLDAIATVGWEGDDETRTYASHGKCRAAARTEPT